MSCNSAISSALLTAMLLLGTAQVSRSHAEDVAMPSVPDPTLGPTLTIEKVERLLTDVEQDSDVAADIKSQSIENLKAAIKNLQAAADNAARLKSLTLETDSVAQRAEQLKLQLSELNDKKPVVESGLSLQELEQLLPSAELQLSAFKKARQDAESEIQARSSRRKEIRARLTLIQEKLTDATSQLRALATNEPTPQSESLAARLVARQVALSKEVPALEAELAKYDAEESADLVRLKIDLAASSAAHTEKLVGALQERISSARKIAAEQSIRLARKEAIAAAPALKVFAEENQRLAEQAKAIAGALAATEVQLKAGTEVYEGLLRQFAQTRKKVDSVGLTSSVGALLRKQKTSLPNVAATRIAVANRRKVLNDTQYELFEYEEAHNALLDADIEIKKMLADCTEDQALLESAARELIIRKREYLVTLLRSSGQYFDTLVELDTTDQQLILLAAKYEEYIDQRVLWIRSGPTLAAGLRVEESDLRIISPASWMESFKLFIADAANHSVVYGLCLLFVGFLLVRGRVTRRSIADLGEIAKKANCRSMAPTVRVMALTCIIALALPLLCLFVGWRLTRCAGDSEFTVAIGRGIYVLGVLWSAVELARQACRPKGMGESHFLWPTSVTSVIYREASLFTVLTLPIVFVTAVLASGDSIHERGNVQRIGFIIGLTISCCFLYRLFRPQGVLREYLAKSISGLVKKAKYLIPVAAIAIPVSLGTLAAAGFFYTAQTLFWRLFATCLFLALLIVVRSLCYRMLLLRRRHLSIEQSRQRAVAAQESMESSQTPQSVAGIVTENHQTDISTNSLQTRQLISTSFVAAGVVGLWMIWIPVLPALKMAGSYPMWGTPTVVSSEAALSSPMSPLASAATSQSAGTAPATDAVIDDAVNTSVTLSDVALSMLIVAVTVMLFRNGPGFLEMSVLQQLPCDASIRYAITTLFSYAIVMIGTIYACSTIGLKWSQIQWLATALTFGLAFGLQEMFANFVAGLIILLERPIRVGDIVTVDEVTGVVSRIRIRATSITNWDRKEYVVPNKEFITGRLLNWTLSDNVNRVVIEIGVAYGSDTEQARRLLLRVADENPTVLKDPASIATFEGFGDNSLNLVLRAFLPSLENRLQTIHELHTAIDQAFRQAGIVVAFPQRDLHIRSVDGAALDIGIGNEGNEGMRDAA